MGDISNTQYFRAVQEEKKMEVSQVLREVYEALTEKGYNPINQIVGYIMSGDPTYITSHKSARSLIMKVERDEKNHRGKAAEQLGDMGPADFVVEKMRILGLDFGSRTVGVAVSDELLLTAQGLETIERKDENKLRKTCARIEEIIKEYGVEEIVLGLPKNMNNTEGDRVEKTKEFKEMLERRTGLLVTLWDERLTTVAAEKVLMESGVRRENRKAVIDKVAACLILQGYLDHHGRTVTK